MLKYESIASDIREKIKGGVYKPNDQLPLEKEMCEKYNVSRITIKKAMDELVMNGLIIKRRGSGSFVKDVAESEIKELSSKQFAGFSTTQGDKVVTTKVIEFKIINPTKEIAEKLKMDEDEFVYYICRARYADGKAIVIEYTYMPINVIPGLRKEILLKSIYRYIEDELKLNIKSAHRIIRALSAGKLEQEYLEVDSSFPLLQVEQVAYLDNGQPFEYSKSNHRSDCSEYKTISVR